jgi:hypothetical protein
VAGERLDQEGEGEAARHVRIEISLRGPQPPSRRAATAWAAAITAAVTGRISTRTPRGRSRVSVRFSLNRWRQELRLPRAGGGCASALLTCC